MKQQSWLERALVGRLPGWQRAVGLVVLILLAVLLTRVDLETRSLFHLNLYPLLVPLAVILFQEWGLTAIAGALALYHLVSMEHQWETQTMLISSLGQLITSALVGGLCLLLVRFYRSRLEMASELSRARRDTVDYLVHEVRNPLFAARGTIGALCLRPDSPPELPRVEKLLENIDELLDQLHDSHAEQSPARPCLQSVKLGPLMETAAGKFQQMDSRHQFQVEVNPAAEEARCDSKMVARILENLLGNAVRYAEPGPVLLKTHPGDSATILSVTDPGPGISRDESDLIFQRHQRGKQGRQGQPGLGIGLYLSRSYAEAQGGTLKVKPGTQGCFELSLPVV